MKKIIFVLCFVLLITISVAIAINSNDSSSVTEPVITEKKEILAGDTVYFIQVQAERRLNILELVVDKLVYMNGRVLYSINGRIYYDDQLFATYEIAESHLDEYRLLYIKY